jgi:hypothetical protein
MMRMNRVMAGLWMVGHDVRRIARGANAFFRGLVSKEDLSGGLGLLSTVSTITTKGQTHQYVVRIANASGNCVEFLLTFHIQAAHLSVPSQGYYAPFTKKLSIQPRRSSTLTIQYDWMDQADFRVGGSSSPPDDFSKGDIDTPQLYAVKVLLCDPNGAQLDELTIYQELIG